MKTLDDLEVSEFSDAIRNAPELRGQQVLYVALAVGPTLFCGVVAFLTYFSDQSVGEVDPESRGSSTS